MNENQTVQKEVATTTDNIKYRYIRAEQFFPQSSGAYRKLCITLKTVLTPLDENNEDGPKVCDWAVALKAPGDQFNKIDARAAAECNGEDPFKSGSLYLFAGYDHNEIVGKILMTLLIQDPCLSIHYRTFIRALLNHHEGFRSFLFKD